MRAPALLLLACAAAWVAVPAAARAIPAPREVTLDEALGYALEASPTIKNAKVDLQRAEADSQASWSWALRAIGANVGLTPPIGTGTWAANAGITVTLNLGELLVGGPAAMNTSRTAVAVATHNLERARLDVTAQVAAAHAAYTAARRVLALRNEAEISARQDEAAQKKDFAAGNAGSADVRRARLAWSQTAADLANAQSEVIRAWAALLAAMGDGAWLERQVRERRR